MAKQFSNPYFKFQKFAVFHDRCAMKVGTDGVLLGAWADVSQAKVALDIGTGSGLIALMMAQRNRKLQIDAIDIDADAIGQAMENVEQSIFSEQISCKVSSVQEYGSKNKVYDLIVSNPPFFENSLTSENKKRTLARHTNSLSAENLIDACLELLSPDGKIALIYPYEYKEKLEKIAGDKRLYINRLTSVYPTPTSKPKRILVEIARKEIPLVHYKLIIETERHVYSPEFDALVKNFYLKK